jgi:hypothetical protein
MKKAFPLALLLLPAPAFAACPKTPQEWRAKAPKIFVAKAALQHAPVDIEDFSARIGKKGVTASATPFQENKTQLVMVQAKDAAASLFLSGVLKCDTHRQEPVLLSLTYVKGDKSGLVKVTAQ